MCSEAYFLSCETLSLINILYKYFGDLQAQKRQPFWASVCFRRTDPHVALCIQIITKHYFFVCRLGGRVCGWSDGQSGGWVGRRHGGWVARVNGNITNSATNRVELDLRLSLAITQQIQVLEAYDIIAFNVGPPSKCA